MHTLNDLQAHVLCFPSLTPPPVMTLLRRTKDANLSISATSTLHRFLGASSMKQNLTIGDLEYQVVNRVSIQDDFIQKTFITLQHQAHGGKAEPGTLNQSYEAISSTRGQQLNCVHSVHMEGENQLRDHLFPLVGLRRSTPAQGNSEMHQT
jgi:hypothetical protein